MPFLQHAMDVNAIRVAFEEDPKWARDIFFLLFMELIKFPTITYFLSPTFNKESNTLAQIFLWGVRLMSIACERPIFDNEQDAVEKFRKQSVTLQMWLKYIDQNFDESSRVVNRWVKHELRRTSGAKCLILIGPSGTGKTSFAKSLPGYYNYFDGQWQLDIWK
ncbi:unnamed protein product, partial [Rotaria sp. Silwood2]